MKLGPIRQRRADLPLTNGRRATGLFRVIYSGQGARWFLYGGGAIIWLVTVILGLPLAARQPAAAPSSSVEVRLQPVVKTVKLVEQVPYPVAVRVASPRPAPAEVTSSPASAPSPSMTAGTVAWQAPSPATPVSSPSTSEKTGREASPAPAHAVKPDVKARAGRKTTALSTVRHAAKPANQHTVVARSSRPQPSRQPRVALATSSPPFVTVPPHPAQAPSTPHSSAAVSYLPLNESHGLPPAFDTQDPAMTSPYSRQAGSSQQVPATARAASPSSTMPASSSGTVTLMGRLTPPEHASPNATVAAEVMIVDMTSGHATRGVLQPDGSFSFSGLRAGALYWIAAWQNVRNAGVMTVPGGYGDQHLSWHQVVQAGQPGTFSLDLTAADADGEYTNDVLPSTAILSPGSGRRASLTRIGG